jgi:hypothetical protein
MGCRNRDSMPIAIWRGLPGKYRLSGPPLLALLRRPKAP